LELVIIDDRAQKRLEPNVTPVSECPGCLLLEFFSIISFVGLDLVKEIAAPSARHSCELRLLDDFIGLLFFNDLRLLLKRVEDVVLSWLHRLSYPFNHFDILVVLSFIPRRLLLYLVKIAWHKQQVYTTTVAY